MGPRGSLDRVPAHIPPHSFDRAVEIGNELIHLDFKSVHSVVALLRPGHLTAEYLDGRRRRYLGPVKMYFLCAALYFLFAAFLVDVPVNIGAVVLAGALT